MVVYASASPLGDPSSIRAYSTQLPPPYVSLHSSFGYPLGAKQDSFQVADILITPGELCFLCKTQTQGESISNMFL